MADAKLSEHWEWFKKEVEHIWYGTIKSLKIENGRVVSYEGYESQGKKEFKKGEKENK